LTCNNPQALAFTKFYEFKPIETIQVLEGPFLNRSLCLGEPGKLQLKVFDRNSSTFSFYYDGELVSSESLGNETFELTIEAPKEEAILNIINEFGCGTSIPIITGVGNPDFSFTSNSLEQTGLISANEKVTFSNVSLDPYVKMEWDFGDGTEILEINAENEATTEISHRYTTPGSFNVTLRFYNNLGCYKEILKEVRIGKGFLVIFPSAFTPNRDGINDIFEPKYTGIKSLYLEIFDMWGNVIHTVKLDTLPVSMGWGWNGTYSSGKQYPHKSFRYRFSAITHDDQEINYTGEATILR
jgi:gliding motility-associated-like protein